MTIPIPCEVRQLLDAGHRIGAGWWACPPARSGFSAAWHIRCTPASLTWRRCSRYSPSWPGTRTCPGWRHSTRGRCRFGAGLSAWRDQVGKDGQPAAPGGIPAGHQAARDPASPDHAGGAGTCRFPRSRRAQREPLRTSGPAAAHRTCAEPTRGLPVGAATIGVPTATRWMTPTPAGRPACEGMPWAGARGRNPARWSRPRW